MTSSTKRKEQTMNKFLRKVMKGNNKVLLLTLPKQASEALKVKAGDTVLLVIENGKVEIRKLEI